jgi:hypothetical protein
LSLIALGRTAAADIILGGGMLTAMGVILVGIALLLFPLAYGLWTVRRWAWPLGVGLEGANILLALARLAGGRETIASALLTLMIAGTILYYLTLRPVRALFGRS